MPDYYSILHLPRSASPKAIRSSYRRLAKTCHPDLHPGDAALQSQFIELTRAYETLANEEARARYDAEHARPADPEAGVPPAGTTQYYTPRSQKDFYKDMMARYGAHDKKPLHIDWLRLIIFSPITYCLLVFIFLVAGYKDVVDSLHAHH